jgi:uncharacterized membrane protein
MTASEWWALAAAIAAGVSAVLAVIGHPDPKLDSYTRRVALALERAAIALVAVALVVAL